MSTPPNPPGNPADEPPWGWQPPGYGSQPTPHNPPHPPPPPPPGYPSPQAYPGYPGYPGYGGYVDPQAPFGRDPVTGLPLSDKAATTAGLLQLFLGLFGVGRFYLDSTQIAVAQLCLGLFGIVFSLFCFLGFPVLLGGIIWAIVDAILIFTGSVKDNHGRKLR
ncbi:NINE protein [Mycobacterium intracellulare]|uniref:NINE protein n=1 Tax=Mycobacterium intracellulare TaxID=1767 RepID=UPI001EEE53C9|nr:NINE protein [Mycobacterium intracellulare]MEE3752171.1 NINE protein [Mycobacterium intracellulare]